MNCLLLGSGGREHAIAKKLSESSHINSLFIAPGNPGTALCGVNKPLNPLNFEEVASFIVENEIQLLVVGPEEPLVKGIRNYLEANLPRPIIIIGAGSEGAIIEGSKDFSKEFMKRHQIPTAAYETFTADSLDAGLNYLENHATPIVLKADGLAAGKGVIITEDKAFAKETLRDMLSGDMFGSAGSRVVVEQFLSGIEISVFAYTNGHQFVLLPEAKDYKRIGEGDSGLNTGGMGAVSPVPFYTDEFAQKVLDRIVIPTVEGLKKDRIPYHGFIFFGLINVDDEPFVIEYNARMGDPETEVVMPRITSDIVEMFIAGANNTLDTFHLQVTDKTATTIFLVSGGYPGDYEKGKQISLSETKEDVTVFHAGTAMKNDELVTSGGRVIAVTAFGNSIPDALAKSNEVANQIQFEGKYFRRDIGLDLI